MPERFVPEVLRPKILQKLGARKDASRSATNRA